MLRASASAPNFDTTTTRRLGSSSAPALGGGGRPSGRTVASQPTAPFDLKASASLASLLRSNPYSPSSQVEFKATHTRLYTRKQRNGAVGASNRPQVGGLTQLYSWKLAESPEPIGRTKVTVVQKRPPPPPTRPGQQRASSPSPMRPKSAPHFARAPEPAPQPWAIEQFDRFAGRDIKTLPNHRPQRPASALASAGGGGGGGGGDRDSVVQRIMGHMRAHMRAKRVLTPVFRAMDEDKSGFLDYGEFEAALRRLGINEPAEHIRWVAEAIDDDGNGAISYDEFVSALQDEEEAGAKSLQEASRDHARQSSRAGRLNQSSQRHLLALDNAAAEERARRASTAAFEDPAAALGRAAAEQEARAREREEKEARAREERERRALKAIAEKLRGRLAAVGSCAALFGRTEAKGNTICREDVVAAFESCGVPADGTLRRFLAEAGVDLGSAEPRPYAGLVTALLDATGLDAAKVAPPPRDASAQGCSEEWLAHEAREAAHVERVLVRPQSAGAPPRPGGAARGLPGARPRSAASWAPLAEREQARKLGALPIEERHLALRAIGLLREKAIEGGNPAALVETFEAHDTDGSGALDYGEFGVAVRRHVPRLSPAGVDGLCRLMDLDGDGTINLREYAATLLTNGSLSTSAAALVRRHELQHGTASQGKPATRYGATPARHYGVQARELLQAGPHSAHFQKDAERFRPKPQMARVKHRAVVAAEAGAAQAADDATRSAQLLSTFATKRSFQAREAKVIAQRHEEAERLAEAKLDSRFNQRLRYEEAAIEPRFDFGGGGTAAATAA